MASTGDTWRLGHRPALDGLRGVAVLLVVGAHIEALPSMAGPAGVTLFFVLSGYLITGKLLTDERNLRRFYLARAVRLVPALAVMVAVVSVVWLAQGRAVGVLAKLASSALLYVENVLRHEDSVFSHTWSLAVEEQFYLLWPLALPLLLKLPRRSAVVVLAGVASMSIMLRIGLSDVDAGSLAYKSLATNTYALLAGCALALAPSHRYLPRRTSTVCGCVALVGAVALIQQNSLGGPVAALAGALLVAASARGVAPLEWLPLRFVGRVSYAWYLWHLPLLFLAGSPTGSAAAPVVSLSFAVATASTLWLEEPLRRTRKRRASVGVELEPGEGNPTIGSGIGRLHVSSRSDDDLAEGVV